MFANKKMIYHQEEIIHLYNIYKHLIQAYKTQLKNVKY